MFHQLDTAVVNSSDDLLQLLPRFLVRADCDKRSVLVLLEGHDAYLKS